MDVQRDPRGGGGLLGNTGRGRGDDEGDSYSEYRRTIRGRDPTGDEEPRVVSRRRLLLERLQGCNK